MRKHNDIMAYFDSWDLDEEAKEYLRHQHPRYRFLLGEIEKILSKIKDTSHEQPIKILDVGPAFQTELLRARLKEAIINTLGFEDIRFKPREHERHWQFDLNATQDKLSWPKLEGHHLVIMAEVIEHLYTPLEFILACVSTWVKAGGYLVIHTPNAVRLSRRLKMLLGENPQEMLRAGRINPGHIREYTARELIRLAKEKGFSIVNYRSGNYLNNTDGLAPKLYSIICNILPADFRDNIFACLQKN